MKEVEENIRWKSVRIDFGSFVKIVRDALPTWGVFKGSAFACDGEEGHQTRPV